MSADHLTSWKYCYRHYHDLSTKIARLESQLATANENISKITDAMMKRMKGKARVCDFDLPINIRISSIFWLNLFVANLRKIIFQLHLFLDRIATPNVQPQFLFSWYNLQNQFHYDEMAALNVHHTSKLKHIFS